MEPSTFDAQNIHVEDGATFQQGHTYHAPVMIHQTAEPEAAPDAVWDVPDILSPHFVGRERDITRIQDAFDETGADGPVRCVVYGMPGLGKTQLALKYADTAFRENRFPYIFWISAASSEKLVHGFSRLLDLIAFAGRHRLDQNARCVAARSWLEDRPSNFSRRWLLILDNANEETARRLWEMIPRRNENGRVLLTTRTKVVADNLASSFQKLHSCINLSTLQVSDAVEIFIRASKTDSAFSNDSPTDNVDELVRRVGNLPLAIDQAASLLAVSGIPLSKLKEIYKGDRIQDALEWENELSHYEQKSVMATYSFALKELQHGPSGTMELLRVLIFLDPEYIPIDLFKDAFAFLPDTTVQADEKVPNSRKGHVLVNYARYRRSEDKAASNKIDENTGFQQEWVEVFDPDVSHVQRLLENEISLHNALRYMQRLSIIQVLNPHDKAAIRIHDLVHLILRQKLLPNELEEKRWLLAAIGMLYNGYTMKSIDETLPPSTWDVCQQLMPHVVALKTYARERRIAPFHLVSMCATMGAYVGARGRWKESIQATEEALSMCKTPPSAQYPIVMSIMCNLAIVYYSSGRLQEATQMAEQAIDMINERPSLGEAISLRFMALLAILYLSLDRPKDADRMAGQAASRLALIENRNQTDVLSTTEMLSHYYRETGRLEAAMELTETLLNAREKLNGPEAPSTIRLLARLGIIYLSLGRFQEAQALFERSVEMHTRIMGLEHPDTSVVMHNAALAYYSGLGRRDEAVAMMERVVRLRVRFIGENHPLTLHSERLLKKWRNEQDGHSQEDDSRHSRVPAS